MQTSLLGVPIKISVIHINKTSFQVKGTFVSGFIISKLHYNTTKFLVFYTYKYLFHIKECTYGYYGDGCSNECGQCQTPPCNNIDGICPNAANLASGACNPGYIGAKCDQRKWISTW